MSRTKVHDLHHLIPRSRKGTNTKDNLRRVPQSLHRSWHLLFRNMLPPEIAAEMNKTWIHPRWRMVAFERPETKGKKKRRVLYEDTLGRVVYEEK